MASNVGMETLTSVLDVGAVDVSTSALRLVLLVQNFTVTVLAGIVVGPLFFRYAVYVTCSFSDGQPYFTWSLRRRYFGVRSMNAISTSLPVAGMLPRRLAASAATTRSPCRCSRTGGRR